MNFIFVKIKWVNEFYEVFLNVGCIMWLFLIGVRIIIGFKE